MVKTCHVLYKLYIACKIKFYFLPIDSNYKCLNSILVGLKKKNNEFYSISLRFL